MQMPYVADQIMDSPGREEMIRGTKWSASFLPAAKKKFRLFAATVTGLSAAKNIKK